MASNRNLSDDERVGDDIVDDVTLSEGEMSDEEEFLPYSDDDTDSVSSSGSEGSDTDGIPLAVLAERMRAGPSTSVAENVVQGTVIRTTTYTGKDGTEWSSTPTAHSAQTLQSNIFTVPRNKIPGTDSANTPGELFSLYMSPDIIKLIVKYTNAEGRRQRGDTWVATDDVEIRAFIGILIFLGAQKQSDVNLVTVWEPLIGQDFVRATMSKNRCFQLLNTLRFDDKDTRRARQTREKLAPISELFEIHSANLERYFVPGPFLTVDEQLVPFRGRCSFIQYIPSKPAKYGLKLFWVCDAQSYYPLKCIVYTGKMSRIPVILGENQGHRVVLELVQPYQNKGRNITMDNFFTDNRLALSLLQRKTTVIGTVRRNKRFLPAEFKKKKHLKLNESLFAFSEKTAMVSYQSKKAKNVIVLSSMHTRSMDIPEDAGEKKKPQVVLDYNATKGGVDTMDQMCLNYTTKRQTKRWPMVLFFNILDTSGIAAHVLFSQKHPDDQMSTTHGRSQFLRAVAKDMMRFQILRR